jgi:hypothetical protein
MNAIILTSNCTNHACRNSYSHPIIVQILRIYWWGINCYWLAIYAILYNPPGTEPEKIIRGGGSITNFLFNNCIHLSLKENKKHIFYLQILSQPTTMPKLLSRTLWAEFKDQFLHFICMSFYWFIISSM